MSRRSNILLVDDTPAKLTALEAVLAPLEQNLISARSGRDALRQLLVRDFAVVLLDVRMHDIDGFEVAKLIRQRERNATTPIIFMTSAAWAEVDMTRGYQLGAVDFILSPIVPEVLRAKVQVFVDLYQQAEAIRELYKAAQDASRAKSDFLNMAAHELRTPLSVVTGYLSMLAEGSLGEPPAGWRMPLQMLQSKSDELNKIVSDLLLASRMDTTAMSAREIGFDLREVIQAAVDRIEARCRLVGATVNRRLPDQAVQVVADPEHIARVLDNLLNNALTYSKRTPVVTIELESGDPALVRVRDNGVGIPPDRREDIFERFVRLDDAEIGPVPGTGLGLYIARQLVRRGGGELVLESSRLGEGSTFAMTIPSATSEENRPRQSKRGHLEIAS